MTKETIQGNIPFVESFIRRVYIFGRLPVSEVADVLGTTDLYTKLVSFIKQHLENCAIATGNEPIYVQTDEKDYVLAFSRETGDYEWTGPACVKRDKIKYSSGNVFNQLEPYLPMKGIKIRAYDIDTYNDYIRVMEITRGWI